MTTRSCRVGLYAAAGTAVAAARSLAALRSRAAENSAWEVVAEYKDVGRARDGLRRLVSAVERGELDLVIFPSLRRFLPMGTLETIRRLALLTRLGVAFVSLEEPSLSTAGPHGESLASLLFALEALERHRVSRRLQRGHASARRQRRIGRPRVPAKTRREIARLREQGKTIAEIAKTLEIAQSTVSKYQNRSIDDLFDRLPGRSLRGLGDPADD